MPYDAPGDRGFRALSVKHILPFADWPETSAAAERFAIVSR
jgi:hypothetical protein